MSTVELHNIATGNQHRTAHALRQDDGALVVEGRDMGPQIRDWFGPATTRYDWGVRVPEAHFPALLVALGRSGGDPLTAVADWFADETRAFEPFLDAHGVVHESWSRVEQ